MLVHKSSAFMRPQHVQANERTQGPPSAPARGASHVSPVASPATRLAVFFWCARSSGLTGPLRLREQLSSELFGL